MLGLQNEREWLVFCEKVLLNEQLARDERFNTNTKRSEARETLKALILQVFSSMTAAQVSERLEEAGIANAQVNAMAEVWSHEQLAHRNRWALIETPVGEMPALIPPGSWSQGPPRMDPVPEVGEHTDSILRNLGKTNLQIDQMRARGSI